jgi:uncharacterized protein (TIRG00374 family)
MRLKEVAKYLGGLVIAVALLVWVLRDADPGAVWQSVRNAWIPGLLLAAGLMVGHNVFRVLRWRALLAPVRVGIPFRPMFSAVILGYMVTWIVPGRLGELVRPALLSGRERLPLGPCLGSVVADRVFDGVAVVVMFLVGVLTTPLAGEAAEQATQIRRGSLLLVGLVAIPLVVLFVASLSRDRLETMFAGRKGAVAWVGRTVLSLARGIEAVKQPRLLVGVVFHTAGAWLMIVGATWVGVRACGAELPFTGMMLMMPLLVLGIAVPTPGGAGGYHAAMTFGLLKLFGTPEAVAVGASFVMHVIVVLPVIALGSVLLLVDRVPFQDLLRAARDVRELGATPGPAESAR